MERHSGSTEPLRSLDSTERLLDRIRAGDGQAREILFARLLPGIRRWARGKLPPRARDLAETDDIVQIALTRSLSRLDAFDPRGSGALMGYLQRVLMNIIRDEYRRAQRLPDAEPLTEGLVDEERSAVEQTLGLEFLAAYDRALEQLTVTQREALVMRVEFGFRFPEIAKALGKPTPNAARMVVMRALVRVAELMDEPK